MIALDTPVPNTRSLVSLIRLIRNMAHHLDEPNMRPAIKELLVSKIGVARYFFHRFPRYTLRLLSFEALLQTPHVLLQLFGWLVSSVDR